MSGSNDRVLDWGAVAFDAPDGLAVVDSAGRFVQVNEAAAALCGRSAADLAGVPAPFSLARDDFDSHGGLLEDGAGEHACTWAPTEGVRREFAYRARQVSGHPGLTIVAFRDVTDEQHRQRRVAAIARTSVKLASEGSLAVTLDALAHEVLQTDALAGVQIMTIDDGGILQIMGSAGVRRSPDFFDRLLQCRDRGAELMTMEAYQRGEPVVVPNRWQAIQSDPAWQPLHEYMSELDWESFVSVPLMIRGRAHGVLNAYFAPGQVVGPRSMEFLVAMADQAAVAVDYATLLQREREDARREERQRLARDLHDSIVQQVFSISMQAKSMAVLGARGTLLPADSVRRIADEVGTLSRTVLADLRAMVHELRPPFQSEVGLDEALRALGESTKNRTGLRFTTVVGQGLEQISGDMAEDVYRIIAEAIHNVVKHADAGKVVIRISVRGGRLTASVTDDGKGIHRAQQESSGKAEGYGLSTMRERAQQWGGTLRVGPRAKAAGTMVRVTIPLPFRMAAVPGGQSLGRSGVGTAHVPGDT